MSDIERRTAAMQAELVESAEQTMTITLTDSQACALWDYFQSDDCPNYWETPLSALGGPLKEHYLYDSDWGESAGSYRTTSSMDDATAAKVNAWDVLYETVKVEIDHHERTGNVRAASYAVLQLQLMDKLIAGFTNIATSEQKSGE